VASKGRLALVVADGDVRLPATVRSDALVIAADGGLLKAEAAGLRADVVVGDGDSLPAEKVAELRDAGVDVRLYPPEKDESDTELAVREAVGRGAERVEIVGGLGGQRFDHALANVLLLGSPDLEGDVALVDGPTTVRVISHELAIDGTRGDYVSLLPLSEEVVGVTTDGLAYPLQGATLRQGPTLGLSNELTSDHASVRVERGRLAVIHTRRQEIK
jgi:thiamine pyrophosphokinase